MKANHDDYLRCDDTNLIEIFSSRRESLAHGALLYCHLSNTPFSSGIVYKRIGLVIAERTAPGIQVRRMA